jgi:hypothetical protein
MRFAGDVLRRDLQDQVRNGFLSRSNVKAAEALTDNTKRVVNDLEGNSTHLVFMAFSVKSIKLKRVFALFSNSCALTIQQP